MSSHLEKMFRDDLNALLAKYNAELEAEDHWTGYPECGEDIRMTVTIPSKWVDGNQVVEYTEIDLGKIVG